MPARHKHTPLKRTRPALYLCLPPHKHTARARPALLPPTTPRSTAPPNTVSMSSTSSRAPAEQCIYVCHLLSALVKCIRPCLPPSSSEPAQHCIHVCNFRSTPAQVRPSSTVAHPLQRARPALYPCLPPNKHISSKRRNSLCLEQSLEGALIKALWEE